MNFDDFDDGYEGDVFGPYSEDHAATENHLDPFNFRDPVSYLFLNDAVQEEIQNPLNRKLKCELCGHEFVGRKTDLCPKCYGTLFTEVA
jgi:rubrerythrin